MVPVLKTSINIEAEGTSITPDALINVLRCTLQVNCSFACFDPETGVGFSPDTTNLFMSRNGYSTDTFMCFLDVSAEPLASHLRMTSTALPATTPTDSETTTIESFISSVVSTIKWSSESGETSDVVSSTIDTQPTTDSSTIGSHTTLDVSTSTQPTSASPNTRTSSLATLSTTEESSVPTTPAQESTAATGEDESSDCNGDSPGKSGESNGNGQGLDKGNCKK